MLLEGLDGQLMVHTFYALTGGYFIVI